MREYSPDKAGDAAVKGMFFKLYTGYVSDIRQVIKRMYLKEFRRLFGDPVAEGLRRKQDQLTRKTTLSTLETIMPPPSPTKAKGLLQAIQEDEEAS